MTPRAKRVDSSADAYTRFFALAQVLDFGPTVPLGEARKGEGYYRIAWGFLKTRGGNGTVRIGTRQLPKDAKPDTNKE